MKSILLVVLLSLTACDLIVGPVEGRLTLPITFDAETVETDAGEASAGEADAFGLDAANGVDTGGSDAGQDINTLVDAADTSIDADASSFVGVRCSTSNCYSGEVCCYKDVLDNLSGSCVAESACFGVPFFCSSTLDCPANAPICCAQPIYGYYPDAGPKGSYITAYVSGATCAATCVAATGTPPKITLCDPGETASVAQCAKLGKSCVLSNDSPQNYSSCQ